MVTPPDIEARILRLYHAEKWLIGTIAQQLHVHYSVVGRVLAQAGLPRPGPPPRKSRIDPYLAFIRQTAWAGCAAEGCRRREFDIVAAWSVCRLGRSLSDLIGLLGELRSRDIDLYLHQQALDTSTPSGRALFGMLGVFSEFERAMIRDRVMAGLDRARSSGKRLGRPRTTPFTVQRIRAALDEGRGVRETARLLKVSAAKVHRQCHRASPRHHHPRLYYGLSVARVFTVARFWRKWPALAPCPIFFYPPDEDASESSHFVHQSTD